MRDQYAGDVSDVVKFALLRRLANPDRRLGIAWYYVSGHDGKKDGGHREWRDEPTWLKLDEELHRVLSKLPECSVAALEQAAKGWFKDVLFHREAVPPQLLNRAGWAAGMQKALSGADLVFLDPDTGFQQKGTLRHATLDEICHLSEPGRIIVLIKFPGRVPHDHQVKQLHAQLIDTLNSKTVVTLRTSVSVPRTAGSKSSVPRARWFTVVDPDAELADRLEQFRKDLDIIPRVRAHLTWTPPRII